MTWEVRATLPISDAAGLAAVGSPANLYLVTATGSLWRSIDAGFQWELSGAVPASGIAAISAGEEGRLLVLERTGGLWESLDDGESFGQLAVLSGSDHVALLRSSSAHYSVTATGLVSRSLDDGQSWELRGSAGASDVVGLAGMNDALILMTGAGSAWQSFDDGVTWTYSGTISQVRTRALISDGEGALYSATEEGEVAVSEDGADWTRVGTVNQVRLRTLASDEPVSSGAGPHNGAGDLHVALGSPWPNPLRGDGGALTLPVVLAEGQTVGIDVFDITGRRLLHFPETDLATGRTELRLDVGRLSAGRYHLRLTTETGRSDATSWARLP
ncbi:MAG: hypothetical protein GF355_09290 [Candidatus Eisenbacteria bacterium]|nr:hypothetical protein [Candidatus Eisenbacteria bacterium]